MISGRNNSRSAAEVRTTGTITPVLLSSKLTLRARVRGYQRGQDLSVVSLYQGVQTSGVDYQGLQDLSLVCLFQGVQTSRVGAYQGFQGKESLPVFPLRQAFPCLLQ